MTHLGYLLIGWGVTAATGAAYAIRLILKGRKLAERVPAERRRWMASADPTSADTR